MSNDIKWERDDGKVRRLVDRTDKSMCRDRERERVVNVDDIKATTLKENKNKNKTYFVFKGMIISKNAI